MPTIVELNKKNENIFYGLVHCLTLLSQTPTHSLLNSAWNEVKNNKEHREMFFSLLFSLGDISNRHHNIFGRTKKDSGGASERDKFFVILNWLKLNHYDQFKKFMHSHIINEFTCFDNLFRNRVTTVKGKDRVSQVYNMLADSTYRTDLANYLTTIINGTNPFDKMLVAKFLTPPRTGIRQGCKKVLPERYKTMKDKEAFLVFLSSLMGWEVKQESWGTNFIGYRTWRREYNFDLESKLFSTGKVNEFDRDEFINWLNKLPSQARFRVKNRVYYADKNGTFKYPKLNTWFKEWEKFKESKQAEERILTEKVRQGTASDEDKAKLKEVSREAQVTTGATSFKDLYNDIKSGRLDKLKLESFANKVNLPYNSLVIIDDSGSMTGPPFNFATFIASICLAKNPDDDARNMLGFFSNDCRFFNHVDRESRSTPNSIIRQSGNVQKVNIPFIDPSSSLYDNYQRIDKFAHAVQQGGGTRPESIVRKLGDLLTEDPSVLDEIKKYPIWTIISDGDMNSFVTSTASMNNFFAEAERILGFRPFVILIDINKYSHSRSTDFVGIPNFIHIQDDPVKIEQVLVNFKDIDVMDVFTPLLSLYRSNRYQVVRQNVL